MPNKGGRPKIEIDKGTFEGLCDLLCTKTEIAGFFHCSEDTIENYCKRTYNECFSAVFKKYAQGKKIALRRLQWQSAEKGSIPMQIWLGRQWLGQTDKVALEKEDIETFETLYDMMTVRKQKLKEQEDADN